MRLGLLIFCFLGFATSMFAQIQPRYTQSVLNPFVYNPALAGKEGRYELHLNHKRQWIGIQDAPVISTLSFHTGFGSGIALGLNLYNFSRGVMNTNNAQLAIGYTVPFGLNHNLKFGLAGSFSRTGLDYSRIDNTGDPAILSANFNHMVGNAQFGVNYHLMGFNLGFSLTNLLHKNIFDLTDRAESAFNPLNSYIVNADYRFDISRNRIALQPYLFYHVEAAQPSVARPLVAQWEGGSLLHFYDKLYVGGSYRQQYGMSAMTGFSLDKSLMLGYAYEFASQMVNTIGQGSHEIQLSFRFGKVKTRHQLIARKKTSAPAMAPAVTEEDKVQPIPQPEQAAKPPVQKEEIKTQPVQQPVQKETILEQEPAWPRYTRGSHPEELPAGYFVVAGVFRNQTNARQAVSQLAAKGFTTTYGYSSHTRYYYVYISQTTHIEECRRIRNEYRQSPILKDVWMLEIKE